ncbi:porin [Neorhizobium sp. NCHU2750]|uniref:porin n=1 Tax=Neorhizobium sp. NCHU2750 TaxID=1825976 RepID=UPI000E764098|nr:porin [Neorhizobium sp. NCHU2750]
MNIKSLLLGSAAALAAVSGAQAADAIVAAEPEPMEYVRVCDAFGAGYFYIPGSETCLKVGGRIRVDAYHGNAYDLSSKGEGTFMNTRAELYMQSASDTEWGALKTNIVARFDWNQHQQTGYGGSYPDQTRTRLMVGTIDIAGFTFGLQDSLYEQLLGYAGNVINDDVINYGPSEVNQIDYTYKGSNGITAFIGAEDDGQNKRDGVTYGYDTHNSDAPNGVAGIKYDNGKFMAGIVGGYDESEQAGVLKARLNGNFGALSLFILGGWNMDGNKISNYAPGSKYGGTTAIGWGDWAFWTGGTYKFSSKLATNVQVAYTDSKVFEATADLAWTPAAGFLIEPEVTYVNIDNDTPAVKSDQWEGIVRFQRTF